MADNLLAHRCADGRPVRQKETDDIRFSRHGNLYGYRSSLVATRSQITEVIGAAATLIFLFSFFSPTGFLGITFLYAAEIAPLSHRSSITAIFTGPAWLFNFVGSNSCIGDLSHA